MPTGPAAPTAIAQRMIAGKLHNSRQVLLRAARDAPVISILSAV